MVCVGCSDNIPTTRKAKLQTTIFLQGHLSRPMSFSIDCNAKVEDIIFQVEKQNKIRADRIRIKFMGKTLHPSVYILFY